MQVVLSNTVTVNVKAMVNRSVNTVDLSVTNFLFSSIFKYVDSIMLI